MNNDGTVKLGDMNPNTYPKSCPDSILKNTGPGIAKLWRNI